MELQKIFGCFIRQKNRIQIEEEIVKKYMAEFDDIFCFVLRNGIDSDKEYKKTK